MTKELTVREISEALGYEIKVVKKQPKPYQFKAGDVVECAHYIGRARLRLIVQPLYTKDLVAVDIHGKRKGSDEATNFRGCNYKKIGTLKAFLVE